MIPVYRLVRMRLGQLGDQLPRLLLKAGLGEQGVLLLIAATVGLLAGAAILGFYHLLALTETLADDTARFLVLPPAVVRGIVLLLGIGLTRSLIRFGTHDSPGENVSAVMHAVARLGGRLQTRFIVVKTLAAAFVIGAGGSVGAEGPVAVLGAGTASATGRWLRFGPDRVRLLVGCGAAAGISGAFGAPIAGLFFAVEKVLGTMRSATLAPLVVASVAAAAVTRTLLPPSAQLIRLPEITQGWRGIDLVLSGLLGAVGGGVAVAYSRGIWLGHDLLRKLPIRFRVLVTSVILALILAVIPGRILGLGPLDLRVLAGTSATMLLAAVPAKIIATSLTLGAAEVGGLFAPALVTGAALGAAVGVLLRDAGTAGALAPAAYALVGMAAIVAGSAHAPLTAIFIVLEMSGDWLLILPLLLAGALSYAVAKSLYPESVYSEWLTRRGERISHGTDENVLARLRVVEAYDRTPQTLRAEQPVESVLETLQQNPQLTFPVLGPDGKLGGILALDDVKRAMRENGAVAEGPIGAMARPVQDTLSPDDTLLAALRRLRAQDAVLLPVTEPTTGRMLGVIGRKEIFSAYERALP